MAGFWHPTGVDQYSEVCPTSTSPRPETAGHVPWQSSGTRHPCPRQFDDEGQEPEMTTTVTSTIRNGVDTATMYATLDAIKAQPEIANFQFRARNTWLGGAHNRTSI